MQPNIAALEQVEVMPAARAHMCTDDQACGAVHDQLAFLGVALLLA